MKTTILSILIVLFTYLPSNAQTFINQSTVNIRIIVSDSGSGIGDDSRMKFSNDGINWSQPEKYNEMKYYWDLNDVDYGGVQEEGEKTVFAKVSDEAGNWSLPLESNPVIFDNKGPVLENVIIQPIIGSN